MIIEKLIIQTFFFEFKNKQKNIKPSNLKKKKKKNVD